MPPVVGPHPSPGRRRVRAAIGLACCLLLLASCQVPGAVRPTVRVGLVAPFEGRYRFVGYDVFPAVRLALREANAAGGVAGYSVELVAYDDGADPQMAVLQADKLALDPTLVAAMGHFRASTTTAALPAYAQAGLPLLAPALLDPGSASGEGTAFWTGPAARVLAAALLDRVEAAALAGGDSPLGQALLEVAAERGLELAPLVSPGADGWLEALLAADPATVMSDADPVAAGEVVAALRDAGWEGTFLGGPELAATDFAAVAGPAAEGALFVTPWPLPEEGGEWAAFIAGYLPISGGTPPGPRAQPAYQAARLLLRALEMDVAAHGRPSRAGVAAALATLTAEGAEGEPSLTWYRLGADGAARPITP